MSVRLVPKSVTFNDLKRRNGHYFALFHLIRVQCRRKKFTFAISSPDEFLVLLNFSKLPTQILQKIVKNVFQAVILRYFSEIGSFRGALRKSGRRYGKR